MTNISPSDRPPTVKDVARVAGVSLGTVSRVLNNSESVGAEYVQRVMEAVEKVGYRPNPIAASMARKTRHRIPMNHVQTGQIGFLTLLPSSEAFVQDEYQHQFLFGIEEGLVESGRHLVLASCARELEKGELPGMVLDHRVDGVVLKLGNKPEAHRMALAISKVLPVVSIGIDYEDERISSVRIDNAGGVRRLFQYLWDLGHRRIGFFDVEDVGKASNPEHVERAEAYIAQVYRNTSKSKAILLQRQPRDRATQSMDDVADVALKEWMEMGMQRPTAIMCAADMHAVSLMRSAKRHGLSLPDDLSTTGFLNLRCGQDAEPPLTTISPHAEQIGREATRMLIEQIEKPSVSCRHVRVEGTLIERLSCAKPV